MTIANRERVSIGGSQGTSQVLREIVDSLRQFVPEISSGGTSRAETSQMNGRSATISPLPTGIYSQLRCAAFFGWRRIAGATPTVATETVAPAIVSIDCGATERWADLETIRRTVRGVPPEFPPEHPPLRELNRFFHRRPCLRRKRAASGSSSDD